MTRVCPDRYGNSSTSGRCLVEGIRRVRADERGPYIKINGGRYSTYYGWLSAHVGKDVRVHVLDCYATEYSVYVDDAGLVTGAVRYVTLFHPRVKGQADNLGKRRPRVKP